MAAFEKLRAQLLGGTENLEERRDTMKNYEYSLVNIFYIPKDWRLEFEGWLLLVKVSFV